MKLQRNATTYQVKSLDECAHTVSVKIIGQNPIAQMPYYHRTEIIQQSAARSGSITNQTILRAEGATVDLELKTCSKCTIPHKLLPCPHLIATCRHQQLNILKNHKEAQIWFPYWTLMKEYSKAYEIIIDPCIDVDLIQSSLVGVNKSVYTNVEKHQDRRHKTKANFTRIRSAQQFHTTGDSRGKTTPLII